MEYKDIRKKFVELSGRYDLVNPDWSDNGADFFINAGQKILDRMQDTGKSKAKNVQALAIGTYKVYVAGLRAVEDVWVGSTAEGSIELKKCSVKYMRSLYGEALSSVDRGTPEWYAPASFRPYPDTETTTSLSGFYDIDDLILPTGGTPLHYTNTGILIMPAPETAMYVSIYGLYYSPTLSATVLAGVWTQTKSFWTESYPDTLIQAALLKLETFYRNSEGVKDWETAVVRDMSGFDKDAAEEEMAGISEMGG